MHFAPNVNQALVKLGFRVETRRALASVVVNFLGSNIETMKTMLNSKIIITTIIIAVRRMGIRQKGRTPTGMKKREMYNNIMRILAFSN